MNPSEVKKLRIHEVVGQVLYFGKYARLMILLFLCGLLAGLVYFIYSSALYYSRALVNVSILDLPVHSDSGIATVPTSHLRMSITQKMQANELIARTAVRLGLVPEGTSYETVKVEHIPVVGVQFYDATTLQIEVFPYSKEVARNFAQALVTEFNAYQLKLRQEYREEAVRIYIAELAEIQKKVHEKLEARTKFERENGVAELESTVKSLSELPDELALTRYRIQQMDQIRTAFDQSGSALDTVEKLSLLTLAQDDVSEIIGNVVRYEGERVSPSAAADPQTANSESVVVRPDMVEGLDPWRKLEKQRRALMEEIRVASNTFLPGHSVMKDLSADLKQVESSIQIELTVALKRFDVEYAKLVESERQLVEKLPLYASTKDQYAKSQLDLALLEKGQLAWDDLHSKLSSSLSVLEFGADKDRVEMRFDGLVSLRDEIPVSPNKIKLVVVGLVLGISLALGVPIGLEMFNNTTTRTHHLELASGLPGIGVVPLVAQGAVQHGLRNSTATKDSVADASESLMEQFRLIRSRIFLQFPNSDEPLAVMITSAREEEGKTTLAVNLAKTFHALGKRTLLVDADLRKGRIHELFGVENTVGLTSLVTGEQSIDGVIHQSDIEGLDVVPTGPVLPGATEKLCRETLEGSMNRWKEKYDFIVMDSPSVLGLSEVVSLQRFVNGLILVIKAESTSIKDAQDAAHLLKRYGAHCYGFILNQVDFTRPYNRFFHSDNASDDLSHFYVGADSVLKR